MEDISRTQCDLHVERTKCLQALFKTITVNRLWETEKRLDFHQDPGIAIFLHSSLWQFEISSLWNEKPKSTRCVSHSSDCHHPDQVQAVLIPYVSQIEGSPLQYNKWKQSQLGFCSILSPEPSEGNGALTASSLLRRKRTLLHSNIKVLSHVLPRTPAPDLLQWKKQQELSKPHFQTKSTL
jgi:hypothetical protein